MGEYHLHAHDPKPRGYPGFKRYVRISPEQTGPDGNQFFISAYFQGYTRHLKSGGGPDDRSADITPAVESDTIAITAGFALGRGEDNSDLIEVLANAMDGYERLNPCGRQYGDVKHKASWLLHRQDTTADEWDESIVAGMKNIGLVLRNHWEGADLRDLSQFAPPTPAARGEAEEMSEKLGQYLELNPQVILAGPPGTSKTHCAMQFLEDADRFRKGEKNGFESKKKYWDIVQFHPSYGYEDFVMGIEAKTNAKEQLGFETRKGIFLKMAREATKHDDCEFYLVIDEINRGVMGRIFGELILTLEYRDFDVHLPGLDEPLRVPKNLFLIGTMNTADRNIALIDHALRRRFMVLKMLPEMRQLESYHEDEDVEEDLQNLSKKAFNIVQTAFKKGDEYDEDKNGYNMEDYAVGHTYFMAKSGAKLKAKVEHQVIPLLGEYMREGIIDKSKYASVKSDLEQLLGL